MDIASIDCKKYGGAIVTVPVGNAAPTMIKKILEDTKTIYRQIFPEWFDIAFLPSSAQKNHSILFVEK